MPAVIPEGFAPLTGNDVNVPDGVSRTTALAPFAVYQRLPSGPLVIMKGSPGADLYSVTADAGSGVAVGRGVDVGRDAAVPLEPVDPGVPVAVAVGRGVSVGLGVADGAGAADTASGDVGGRAARPRPPRLNSATARTPNSITAVAAVTARAG